LLHEWFFQIESLIPLKDDRDIKSELEKKRGENLIPLKDERDIKAELVQQLTAKNRHLKELIDSMRGIIWEVNTMLEHSN
jgi:CYTH domain-containing protein